MQAFIYFLLFSLARGDGTCIYLSITSLNEKNSAEPGCAACRRVQRTEKKYNSFMSRQPYNNIYERDKGMVCVSTKAASASTYLEELSYRTAAVLLLLL